MSEPTKRDELDYKGLLLTRKFNPFFWRNLYEETGGDEYWMHKDEKGRYTEGNRAKTIPDDHPVLKEFADYKKKLGLEGDDAIREIFKGKENLKRLGLLVVKGDDKYRFAQVFLDYDSSSQKSKKETNKPREQRMISSYLRQRYFNLGLEDPKFSSFSKETGKVEVPASKALKKYLDIRKELSEKLQEKGFDVSEEKDEEETYYDDIKDLEDLQKPQETELSTQTETEIPAAAPAPAETPAEIPAAAPVPGKGGTRGMGKIPEIPTGIVPETAKAIEDRTPVTPAQPPNGIDSGNTNSDFAAQTTAPSDTMEERERQQMEQEDPIIGTSSSPATPQQNVAERQAKPVPAKPTDENDPIEPPDLSNRPDELQTPRQPQEIENIDNKNPSVSMDITKDRINIGEKVDDIPTETILDKIPESRFSSQFKTIKQLNDDIKYFIKNFGNVVGKDLIKQYNEADKTNLQLVRRLHGLIGGKLKTDNQKEKKVGIIIDADEYINQKINDALLNRGVSMNVPAGVRTNLESESVKEDKSIGNFDVRKAREGGLLAVRREPVYRFIPSNNEKMNEPVDSRKQIKNGGLRMLPTQRRDLATTARKQVRDDPFARKHNPRKIICLY